MPRASTVGLLVLVAASSARAADTPQPPGPPAPPDVRSIVISPAPAPLPLFKYRLFPLDSTRKEGNSVPIYLRFAHERSAETKKLQITTTGELLAPEWSKFDAKASREHIDKFTHMLQQMDFAARKRTTDWSYTLEEERENAFGILLPDAQESRAYHRLMSLKARVEIAEGKFEQAARSLETGFSMADQAAQGPFFINGLIGLACAIQTTDRVEEFIGRPGAPNLYWSLAALPVPLIDMRRGIDNEYHLMYTAFPELEGLDRAEGAPEFEARLGRLKARFNKFAGMMTGTDGIKPEDLKIVEPLFPRARAYLLSRKIMDEQKVAAIPEAKAILLALRAQWEEIRDERFKALYLPPPEARVTEAASKVFDKKEEILPFTAALMPWFFGATHAQTRLERRVAVLRLIEAIRMQAAADGKLPASLDDIKVVTIPVDPSTGKPFGFKREGDAVVIESPRTGKLVPEIKYTITLRK